MAWKIELSAQTDRELGKLDPQQSKRIPKFLRDRVAPLDNPRSIRPCTALHSGNSENTWLAVTASSARSKTGNYSFWFYASATGEKSTADFLMRSAV